MIHGTHGINFFLNCVDNAIPSKHVSGKPRKPWITPDIVYLSKKKRSLRRRALKSGKQHHWLKYKTFSNHVRLTTRSRYINYINNLCNNSNSHNQSKQLWSVIRQRRNLGTPNCFNDNNHVFTTKAEIACQFNRYFESCFTPPNNIDVFHEYSAPIHSIDNLVFSPEMVCKAILKLKNCSRSGPHLRKNAEISRVHNLLPTC